MLSMSNRVSPERRREREKREKKELLPCGSALAIESLHKGELKRDICDANFCHRREKQGKEKQEGRGRKEKRGRKLSPPHVRVHMHARGQERGGE